MKPKSLKPGDRVMISDWEDPSKDYEATFIKRRVVMINGRKRGRCVFSAFDGACTFEHTDGFVSNQVRLA